MKRTMFASAVALALAASPAFAQSGQTNPTTQPRTTTPTTQPRTPTTQPGTTDTHATGQTEKTAKSGRSSAAADQMFVKKAAEGGMAEVELGKLAADKASNPDVKKFGQRMADDHGKANDELKSIAGNKNITLPTDLNAKDKALRDRLSKLSGEAFDRAYMQAMVRDHRMDVNEFKHESTAGKDPDVKAFAAKTLPTLEDHLKQAQSTDKAVVGTSGTSRTTGASIDSNDTATTEKTPDTNKK